MVKEFIKQHGWDDSTTLIGAFRVMSVDIAFEHGTNDDEVEFDINCYDEVELDNLFKDFCKENNLSLDQVNIVAITIVNKAETMNKLIYGEDEQNTDIRICPICRKKGSRNDMSYTKDCHGITHRLVCDNCYQKVMFKGYDGKYYSVIDENIESDY